MPARVTPAPPQAPAGAAGVRSGLGRDTDDTTSVGAAAWAARAEVAAGDAEAAMTSAARDARQAGNYREEVEGLTSASSTLHHEMLDLLRRAEAAAQASAASAERATAAARVAAMAAENAVRTMWPAAVYTGWSGEDEEWDEEEWDEEWDEEPRRESGWACRSDPYN